MWGNHEDWMWGMGGLHMGLGWILILVVVAVVVWLLVRGQLSVSGRGAERPGALDILKERYARGEIDREEFEQKKTRPRSLARDAGARTRKPSPAALDVS